MIPANCLLPSENKFWYSTGQTKLKAFHGYFDFVEALSSMEDLATVKFSFLLDGTATQVSEIVNGKSVNGKWYDLSGRRVTEPQRGIYIVNGSKVVK